MSPSPRPEAGAVPDFLDLIRLDGRSFIVFGAGAGMGRQAAHAISQAGAKVVCVDRDAALAAEVAAEVGGTAVDADATDRASVAAAFAAAKEAVGPIGGIVDVIGMATIGKLADLDDAGWDRQFDLVVRHAYLILQQGAEALREVGGGTMVFVGSFSGDRAVPDQSAYGAAKAALHHLVRCMGSELATEKVRVNAVAPGWVRTPRLAELLSEEAWDEIDATIPRGSAGVPSEIAAAILFLSSALSSYVTGQVLSVDGGLTTVAPFPDVF
jgi:NAD(P)-dependent dehydrogenase (short-subunit alcohol dehydrogenase family)